MMWTELKLCTDPKEVFLQLMARWWRGIPGRGEREQKCSWHVQNKGKMLKPHNLIRASKCLIFPQMCPFSLPLESHLGRCQEAQHRLYESIRRVLHKERGLCFWEKGSQSQGNSRVSYAWTGRDVKEKQSASAAASAPRQQQGTTSGKGSWTEGWGRRVGRVEIGRASARSGGSDSFLRCWCGYAGGVLSSLSLNSGWNHCHSGNTPCLFGSDWQGFVINGNREKL